MKNLLKTKNAQVGYAGPVPAGSVAGQVVALGADGLTAVLITERATTDKINQGLTAPGVGDGEASVELVGVSLVTRQPNVPAVNRYAALYVDNTGAIKLTATGNIKIGYALDQTTAPGSVRVAHV